MYSESELIRRIRERFGTIRAGIGIGDDAAVVDLPPGFSTVLCSDLLAEGTHFRRTTHPAPAVAYKAIAVNVSDVGAMGAIPTHFLMSLTVGPDTAPDWIDGFLDGVAQACAAFDVELVGGDSASSDRIFVDIAMIGRVEQGAAVRRNGARIGDAIYVTGALGGSGLGLSLLESGLGPGTAHDAIRRHLYPEPRQRVGRKLAGAATAMIDLSDGLSTDLSRILSESGVSARIEADRIPRFEGATLDQALHSGEDYELLITAGTLDPECDGVPITAIGEIVDGPPGRILMTEGGIEQVLEPRGWEHFG